MHVLLLVVAAATAVCAQNSYLIVVPAQIRPQANLSLSVNILKASSDVTVTATILRDTVEVASGKGTFKPGVPSILSIKVPASLPNAAYTLRVDGSDGLTFHNTTTLAYNSKVISLFIQTDKPIYKPGDVVNFRVFGTYPNLTVQTGPMNISIVDAGSNKIKQWLQEQPADGVATKQLTLSTQPVLGDWKIRVETATGNVEKTITVQQYVLPSFEVSVVMPPFVLTSDSDITVTVKTKYTYGKPVKGRADVELKFLSKYDADDSTKAQTVSKVQTQVDGEVKVSIPLSSLQKITSSLDGHILVVVANVTESLTGNTMSANGTVKLYDKPVVLEFPKMNPNTFKPGLRYTAYLKVSQPDGRPVQSTNQKVRVNIVVNLPGVDRTFWRPAENTILPEQQLDIPDDGLVAVSVDFPKDARSGTITAEFQEVSTSLRLGHSRSPSASYIQMSPESASNIQAGDLIKFKVKSTEPLPYLAYQIMSRGLIVLAGSIDTQNKAESSFSIKSDSSMAPSAHVIAYYVRPDGEVLADSVAVNVGGFFKNKVSLSLNTTDAEPGDDVLVSVSADPGSKAYLTAIDTSVLLLKSGNDVTDDDVRSELQTYNTVGDSSDGLISDCIGCFRSKRSIWWPFPHVYGGNDAYQVFQKSGVKVVTDAMVYQERIRRRFPFFLRGGALARSSFRKGLHKRPASASRNAESGKLIEPILLDNNSDKLMEPTRTRTDFSETWLWAETSIGSNGTSSVVARTQDGITSWVVSSIAVNPTSGLGISPVQPKLRVFRPFFVSMNLPYSVTRGERLALQTIVFNYLPEDMEVRVTMAKSDSFSHIVILGKGREEIKQGEASQTIFVKAGEAKSVYFPIVPNVLGKIDLEVKAQSTKAADAMRRQLLVKVEGLSKEYTMPVLIDLTEGTKTFTQMVNLSLPAKVVKDSQRVEVTAVGDLLGPSLSGLDSLIQLPTGCGEQTMLNLAPVVSVTDYLNAVNQLSPDIKTKALGYMESGYQRELTYKHKDGSFSAFGENDKSGSMWLTAFVCKAFHQARPYIFVDDQVLITALNWIIAKQNSDGSFPESGNVIHKAMQGDAAGGNALTVYVLSTLLENKDVMRGIGTSGEQAIAKALAFVESAVATTEDVYILAMASYVLQLANSPQTKSVLEKLDRKASTKDGLKFWQKAETVQTTTPTWESPNPKQALSTEMTSYVAAAYIERGEIATAKNIIGWITKQRNSNGGFQSTQDTVVALYALSQFAKKIYSNNFKLDVTVTLSPALSFQFHIDQSNALVLQSQETTTVPSKVKVEATGSGIALVSISVFFNVELEIEKAAFELTVKLVEENINYLVLETCTRWIGEGEASGMAIQEVGFPSGFDPVKESITNLPLVKLTEIQNRKVNIYFDKIGRTLQCLRIKATRTDLVTMSQPASVTVKDYYSPDKQVTVTYTSQILKNANICEVCPACEKCAV